MKEKYKNAFHCVTQVQGKEGVFKMSTQIDFKEWLSWWVKLWFGGKQYSVLTLKQRVRNKRKKITRCATFYREMWKLKALKGSSCGVGCYQSHITVKPTARLFVETSNYFKRRYFNCRSLMTGMKHAIHLMKRTLTSDKRAKIDEVIRYCFAIVLSS